MLQAFKNISPRGTQTSHLKLAKDLAKLYIQFAQVLDKSGLNKSSSSIFPNIPRTLFAEQLLERIETQTSINQGHTWLCGAAASTHVLLNLDPLGFLRMAILLYEMGKGSVSDDLKPLLPSKAMRASKETDADSVSMAVIDYIILGSLRGTLNKDSDVGVWLRNLFAHKNKYNPNTSSEKSTGTWPMEMRGLLEEYYGFEVASCRWYGRGKVELHEVKLGVARGQTVILFVDGNLKEVSHALASSTATAATNRINDMEAAGNYKKARAEKEGKYDIIGIHYIVIRSEDGFQITTRGKDGQGVKFSFWDYGSDTGTPIEVPMAQFMSSVKGFWCVKPKYASRTP